MPANEGTDLAFKLALKCHYPVMFPSQRPVAMAFDQRNDRA